MIPLVWVLFLWLAGVSIFALLSLLTVALALRFGLTGMHTFFFCVCFLAVSIAVIGGTGAYISGVDWTQDISYTQNAVPSDNPFLFP